MQNAEYSVALTHLVDKLKLENCTPNVPIDDVKVTQSDVNRPALQLAGFFDYFDSNRIQIIGQVEYTYMEQKGVEYSVQMLEEIMCGSEKSTKPPCIVFCRNLPVDDRLIELATKHITPDTYGITLFIIFMDAIAVLSESCVCGVDAILSFMLII